VDHFYLQFCRFGQTIAKTLGLSALAGAASEGASQIVKKISGKGVQSGGFLVPQNKIDQLIAYKHLIKKSSQKKSSEKGRRSTSRKKFTLQKRSSLKHSIKKPKFHKNIPLSNYDLIDWCKYLKIPINDVLSRDETVRHNHRQALFIYNLEPAYMSGSHWVTTHVKDNVVSYFDSFGLPPFQEIVNHARKKNLTLLHQNNQIQNLYTTTCGYFCLYFLNEMNKGKTYFDLLKVFDIHDTMKNEKFIQQYFKNI